MIVAWLLLSTLTAQGQDVERGRVLAGLGGCASCHVSPEGQAYAGGYAIDTSFGTFYGPNLTSDREHGLGAWSEADFVGAMQRGRAPDGHAYWPAFPYLWFTHSPRAELVDLWAYLQTIPPSPRANTPHAIKPLYRGDLGLWRSLVFREGPLNLPVDTAADVALGAVLVEGLGHCAGCHTPRNGLGAPRKRQAFAGTHRPPEPAPNLTPHEEGLADWSASDLRDFLETAMTDEGDVVGGHMGHIVHEGTALLSQDERDAIVAYLMSLRPRPDGR